MKFSVSSTELQKVLGNVGSVIPSKSTLPILENFLFEVTRGDLKITATDLDTSMSVTLKVKSGKDGVIAVPAKKLFETVRSLPNTEITFTAEPENNRITMATENGEYKLTGESNENYPSIPPFKGTEEIELESETLRRLISKTVFAVSGDELRPAMTGILFQFRKNEIRAVATDGHRLVRLTKTNAGVKNMDRDIVVPARALNVVLKTLGNSETTISFSEGHAMFKLGESVLISRMIEEKYPNYESVIPNDNNKNLVVDKNQLLSSVRRTALYASSATHQVRLSLKKGSITVSAEDIDFGSEARETIPCEYGGESLEIGFNSSYIVDILSHIDTDEATFSLNSPTRACIVEPTTQRDGENVLMLVMPVRLNA